MSYRVTIPRTVIEDTGRSERQEIEATLLGLHDKGVLTRQDRIDDTEDERSGAVYFTEDERLFKILTAIARQGYQGLVENRELINIIAQEQGVQ